MRALFRISSYVPLVACVLFGCRSGSQIGRATLDCASSEARERYERLLPDLIAALQLPRGNWALAAAAYVSSYGSDVVYCAIVEAYNILAQRQGLAAGEDVALGNMLWYERTYRDGAAKTQ